MGQVSNARRGNYTCTLGLDARISKPGREGFRDPCAGFTRVQANDDAPPGCGRKMMSQGFPNGIYGFFIQRVFPDNSADSISAEKFSQTCAFLSPSGVDAAYFDGVGY